MDKMIYESFLPISALESCLVSGESLNFSASSWATKYGKACGRNVVDCGDGGTGSGLNTDDVKMMADEIWAPIHHPNLLTIVHMIQDFFVQAQTKDPSVSWDDLRFFFFFFFVLLQKSII